MNNDELISAGHGLAKCLDSNTPLLDIAKMIVRLADKLDVTTAALREKTKQCDAEHNDVLVWEKTMFMVCGEDGVKSVAEKFASLEASRAALAAENAALIESHKYVGLSPKYNEAAMMEMKRPFIDELIHSSEYYSVCGHISAATNRAIKAVHGDYSWLPETPATDAFIAELRAQGVELLAEHLSGMGISASETSVREFAAQLRQGGAA
ncbi:hypothetical protein SM003_003765 [Cronobacter malonaticus]|nr:hypothetical protein [Cronobacter malonaticus]